MVVRCSVLYFLISSALILIGFFLENEARAGRFLSGAMQLHSQLIAVLHSLKFLARKVSSVCISFLVDPNSVLK